MKEDDGHNEEKRSERENEILNMKRKKGENLRKEIKKTAENIDICDT